MSIFLFILALGFGYTFFKSAGTIGLAMFGHTRDSTGFNMGVFIAGWISFIAFIVFVELVF